MLDEFDTQKVCILQLFWRLRSIAPKLFIWLASLDIEPPSCKCCIISDGRELYVLIFSSLDWIKRMFHLDLVACLVLDGCIANYSGCMIRGADVPDSEDVVSLDTKSNQISRIRREGHRLDTFLMESQSTL